MKHKMKVYANKASSLFGRKQDQIEKYSGFAGLYSEDGAKIVEVAGRPGYIYVRLLNDLSGSIQAYNNAVLPVWGIAVEVERVQGTKGMVWRVVGVDPYSSVNITIAPGVPYLPRHGDQHSMGGGTGTSTGSDPVWVYKNQFMPLNVTPSSPLSMRCQVSGDSYQYNNNVIYFGTTGTADFTSLIPPVSNQARIMTVCLNAATNELDYITGSLIPVDTAIVDPYEQILLPTNPTDIPLKAIMLVGTMSTINWQNLYDIRTWLHINPSPSFLGLFDTPDSYTGSAGRVVVVNNPESGLEFRNLTGTSTSFLDLTDTPNSYDTYSGSFVTVDLDQNELVFTTRSSLFSGSTPQDVVTGTASPGTSMLFARADHNHRDPFTGGGGGGGGTSTYEANWASPPTSPPEGSVWFVSDAPLTARYNGSAWKHRWYGIPVELPPNSSWTWFNQGSATLTDLGIQRVIAPTGTGGDQLRGVVRSVTAPYTVYMKMRGYYPPGASTGFGLCARQASDGKLKVIYYQGNNAHNVTFEKWNSGTSYNSTIASPAAIQEFSSMVDIMYCIKDDNADFSISISPDNGVTWYTGWTEARTTFATCDQVGFFAYTTSSSFFAMCELAHWVVTS